MGVEVVGNQDGESVGEKVGTPVGPPVGCPVGDCVGLAVGLLVSWGWHHGIMSPGQQPHDNASTLVGFATQSDLGWPPGLRAQMG